MKKLSPAQQKVIDCMKANPGCYIYHSPYYDFQKVVSPIEITNPDGYKHHHLLYFKITTFMVLFRLGLIEKIEDRKYKLTNI